jgi:aminopeptidase
VIDPDALAALLCDWSVQVRTGDQVLVAMTMQSFELARALHNALLEREAWPLIRLAPGDLAEDFYRHARELHLDSHPPIELAQAQALDALIAISAPANTRALAGVDAELIARASLARQPIQEAQLRQGVRWCGTLWPTAALAQEAGMGEREYERFVTRALFLDRPDPVSAWRQLAGRQEQLVQRLSAAREVRIEAEGTDLRMRVDGRRWINSDGRHNMPSGEVFTGPREDSAQGTIRFTLPSNRQGVLVADVELTFEGGQVASARAAHGDAYLQAALATDAGARWLGELGIGTNAGIDRASGSTLLDEKMAGTVHLALGRSYPETGGRNRSALHWDLICDLRGGGRLLVDGEELEPFS